MSMTDMTVSFLFIVMILLAFFATQYSDEDNVPRSLLEVMRVQRDAARMERDEARDMLAQLKERLQEALSERDEARDERDTAREKVQELEAEMVRLKEQIRDLEERLAQLQVRDPLEAYLARAAATRRKILEELRNKIRIDFPDLQVEISAESDALRFQGEGLFDVGRNVLRPRPRHIVETIADRLDEVLPCYTLGEVSSWSVDCNPGLAVIEAVQIEGHTDSTGKELSNLDLSTARANTTFAAMWSKQPDLIKFLNYRLQPVLSVAGYGQMRPVTTNETAEGRATNRRIDLRIIMYTPRRSEEIEKIRKRLSEPLSEPVQ